MVGAEGGAGDAGMFSYSNLMKGLDTNSCNLPPAEPLEMDTVDTPYYVTQMHFGTKVRITQNNFNIFLLFIYLFLPKTFWHTFVLKKPNICIPKNTLYFRL